MKETTMIETDVIIVGAGLAGLMAANKLQENGRSVIILEKGRGVGGRMATWRMGNGRADYGTQFFTVRTPQFQKCVDQWLANNLVFEWSKGWTDGSIFITKPDGYSRYAVTEGMTALPKHLAQNLTIHKNCKVVTVRQQKAQWHLSTEDGAEFSAKALILTPPVPQTLALLATGNVALSANDRHDLEQIEYAPCWSALVEVNGDVNIPTPGALQRPGSTISWIADNQQKGISGEAKIITMHISAPKSRLWFLAPSAEIEGVFRDEIRPFLTPNSTIQAIKLHRWRYALPTTVHPERILVAQNLPTLIFAGDAFAGPRIESAALSGLAAAEKVLETD